MFFSVGPTTLWIPQKSTHTVINSDTSVPKGTDINILEKKLGIINLNFYYKTNEIVNIKIL